MSIVRIGLGETKDFAEGYDAIFGKKEKKPETKAEPAADAKKKPAAGEAKSTPPSK